MRASILLAACVLLQFADPNPLWANGHARRFPVSTTVNVTRTTTQVRAPGVNVNVNAVRDIDVRVGRTFRQPVHVQRDVFFHNVGRVDRGIVGYTGRSLAAYVAPPSTTFINPPSATYAIPEQIQAAPMDVGPACGNGGCPTTDGYTGGAETYVAPPRAPTPAPTYTPGYTGGGGCCGGCCGSTPMTYSAPQRVVTIYREVQPALAPPAPPTCTYNMGYSRAPGYAYVPSYNYIPSYTYGYGLSPGLGIGYAPGVFRTGAYGYVYNTGRFFARAFVPRGRVVFRGRF